MGRRGRRMSALIAGLFLLCGALRVLTYHMDLFDGFSNLFCAVLVLLWALTVRTRVTDRRLRRLILCAAASLLLFLTVQLVRGNLIFGNPVLARYCWYSYYIPYIGTPLFLFLCAVAVYRPKDIALPRWAWVVAAVAAALILCALTNDLHQLMFRFPGGVFRDTDDYTPGLFFWLYFACYGALLLAGFVLSVVKARRIRQGLSFLLPAVPPLLLGIWMVQNLLHSAPSVGGVKLWLESETFTFAIVAYLECCIQIGLISANTGYGVLFSRLELPAVILDRAEEPVYRSGSLVWPFPNREELLVHRQPVSGGSVVWATDVSALLELNRRLEENAKKLAQRNAFLTEEGQMKKDMAALDTRNRLYEQITRAVAPELRELEALSREEGPGFADNLPRICVLTTFVKRRSNMELLAADGALSVEELAAALQETLDYLRLGGVQTALSTSGVGILPADVVISAYEHVQAVIMEALEGLRVFFTRVTLEKDGELELRMLLQAEDFSWDFSRETSRDDGIRPAIRLSMEHGELNIVLRYPKGGGAV